MPNATAPSTADCINSTPYQRIGLIGDVHAEDQALATTLEFLASQQLDAILCTGDVADGPGDINRCCELLEDAAVITVRGNHDRWLLTDKVRHVDGAHHSRQLTPRSQAFLRARPAQVRLNTHMGTALLCHGVFDDDLAKVWPGTERMPPERSAALDDAIAQQQYQLLINGHMHYRTLVYFQGLTLLNAGTLRSLHRPGFSILDFTEPCVEAYEFMDKDTAGASCQAVKRLPLSATAKDTVWVNSAAFNGDWTPTVLYAT